MVTLRHGRISGVLPGREDVKQIVYLNSEYVPVEEAKISVNDRGFTFGDSIYEVTPVIHGVPIDFDLHIARLRDSCEKISIELPWIFYTDELGQIVNRLLSLNGAKKDYKLYIQISRGVAERNHILHEKVRPTVLVMLQQFVRPPRIQEGMAGFLVEDCRWAYRDIKSTSILANVLAKKAAFDAGASEAILYDTKPEGKIVTEGSSCNIFIVDKRNRVITHPVNSSILSGVTRHRVIQIAIAENLQVCEQVFTIEELLDANEVFATASGIFIRGIHKVGKSLIKYGEIGVITRMLEKLFNEYVDKQLCTPNETRTKTEDTTTNTKSYII
ncbi:aminotransferase class IV family protein [Neorickettsia helminthoeca str. Oregon]|uniref:Probable branched-chain-amino-acid aminotransferase n=1 Tax=Neorickettsia helminthoeca str. Oregon TaxID=1286528 RepID=X5HL28_9RICK|nr:aminotransferase class IV [Neorickettsia helminthoeca]AHX11809.1 aminotransferase class IV family protein [Neorickettsia helminthoeca str. Oregon]